MINVPQSDEKRPSHEDRPRLIIRRAKAEDAEAITQLSSQLGYETSIQEIQQRIERLADCVDTQVVFVACLDKEMGKTEEERVGWIEAAITYHLQSPPFVLIGGLVVKDGVRGLGIGRRLCEEVEAWARAQDIPLVRVTSRSTRQDAHRFYLRDGYKQTKISYVFEKHLD